MQTQPPPYIPPKEVSELPTQDFQARALSYYHIVKSRKEVILGSIILSLFIALLANLTQKPVYQAKAELLLQARLPSNTSGGSSQADADAIIQDPTILLTQFRLIKGPSMAETVLKKLEKPENRNGLLECFALSPSRGRKETSVFSEKERRRLLSSIQGSLSGNQLGQLLRIITIAATGHHPLTVARLANAAAESYIEMTYKSNIDSFQKSFSLVSQTLAEIREKIKTGEFAFQKIDSEIKLMEALKVYGERHPLVIQLRQDAVRLAEKLKHEIHLLESSLGQRTDLALLLTKASINLEELQKIEADLYILRPILEQELNTNREMYNAIFKRLQDIEISEGGGGRIEAKLVEPASTPGRPIRPNKKMNLLLGLLIGLLIGTGLAFFLEYLDSSLRNTDDVRFYLRLFPFGIVPQVEFSNGQKDSEEIPGHGLPERSRRFWNTNDHNLPLYVSEAYRIIRTNLSHGPLANSYRVLQVTSAVKGEGKTTTTCNLGISLAQAGIRTLLVDADLRKPSLNHILDLAPGRGLSDILSRSIPWQETVQPTQAENLFCVPSGEVPPNPAELLTSKQMKPLLDEMREQYDMVILDSPPIVSVADATIIASQVEGSILVSRAGFIPRSLCLHAKNSLESVNGKIIGCILNGVSARRHSHYQNYYEHYYDNYSEDASRGKGKKKDGKKEFEETHWLQQLQALREPLWVLLASSWARFTRLIGFGTDDKNARDER